MLQNDSLFLIHLISGYTDANCWLDIFYCSLHRIVIVCVVIVLKCCNRYQPSAISSEKCGGATSARPLRSHNLGNESPLMRPIFWVLWWGHHSWGPSNELWWQGHHSWGPSSECCDDGVTTHEADLMSVVMTGSPLIRPI